MIIPNFEIKDSYILKNSLNYDLQIDSGLTYGMIFTDYDLARKIQPFEDGNFDPIIIGESLSTFTGFTITYYNQLKEIRLGNNVTFESSVSFTTDKLTRDYQEYYVSPSTISNMVVGDGVEIVYHDKKQSSGNTTWEHEGDIGETWFVSGLTEDNTAWEVTGTTTISGESTGTTVWSIDEVVPVLRYVSEITEVGVNYIRVDRKVENYLYNNLQYNYTNLFYEITNLQHADKTYANITKMIEKSPFGKYFEIEHNLTTMTITPVMNDEDIYFDYDDVRFALSKPNTVIVHQFETNNLYNNYTLEKVFTQLGISGSTDINVNSTLTASSVSFNGSYYFDFEVTPPSGVTIFNPSIYFTPYTYVEVVTNLSNTYISLLTEFSGTTFTIVTSPLMMLTETIESVTNLTSVADISLMLNEVYINIEDDVDVIVPTPPLDKTTFITVDPSVTFIIEASIPVFYDWGDGTSEEVLSGVNASHSYIDGLSGHTITAFALGVTDIICSSNGLIFADVSENLALDRLIAGSNDLTSLDVTTNVNLTYLYLQSNDLASLDVSANTGLTHLSCGYNNLTTLDVSTNILLGQLFCYYNDLTALNVDNNIALYELGLAYNNVSILDVSNNINLSYLACNSNNISTLGLSTNTALTRLYCQFNNISALDVSTNTLLTIINCTDNNISALDVSTNTVLTSLYSQNNDITTVQDIDDILNDLDVYGLSNGYVYLHNGTNAIPSTAGFVSKANLEAKGWVVIVY